MKHVYRIAAFCSFVLAAFVDGYSQQGYASQAGSGYNQTQFMNLVDTSAPWLVRMHFEENGKPDRKVACSGTHLGYGVVLTAAHCLFGYNGPMVGTTDKDGVSYVHDETYYVKTVVKVLKFITGSPKETSLVFDKVGWGMEKFLIHPKYYEEYKETGETFANKKQAAFDLALVLYDEDDLETKSRVLLPKYQSDSVNLYLGDTAWLFGVEVNPEINSNTYSKGYFGGQVQFDYQGGSNLYSSVANYFTRGQTGESYLKEVCSADSAGAAVKRTADGDVLLGILSQSSHRPLNKNTFDDAECPKVAKVNLIHYHRQFIADSIRELSSELYEEIKEVGFVPDNYDVAPENLPQPVIHQGGSNQYPLPVMH